MENHASSPLPRFLVLEGVDGAGTTTQLRLIDEALMRSAVPHWITFEPTDRSEGALIRRILGGELDRSAGTVAHLFAADRYEHLYGAGGILQHLALGEVVVCDRYLFSSLAYQGVTCGPDLPFVLNRDFPLPELLIYFDIAPEVSFGRLGGRNRLDIYEKLPIQERVRAAYEAAIARFKDSPMKVVRLNAGLPLSEVSYKVLEALGHAIGVDLLPPLGTKPAAGSLA